MEFYAGQIYHIYNRGNIHQKVFYERKNYLFFLRKMEKHLKPYCHILTWCLMPNHFHWLVKVKETKEMGLLAPSDDSLPNDEIHRRRSQTIHNSSDDRKVSDVWAVMELNKSIGVLLRSYTRAMNLAYKSKGSLFQQKTGSKDVNTGLTLRDNYALICFLYILQNPVKAGLVRDYANWEFSSYQDYAGLRNGRLCNKTLATELLELPNDKEEFIRFARQALPDHYQEFIF